jgi:hypothetical protein
MEDTFRCLFDQVKDVFESGRSAVVGVGDVLGGAIGNEIAEEVYLLAMTSGGVHRANVPEVVSIHGNDEIESDKIAWLDLPGETVEPVAASGSGLAHSSVRRLPGVIPDRAGGIDVNGMSQAAIGNDFAEDALSSWGAADIAHADE